MSLIRVALFYLLEIISIIIFVRCIMSWFPIGNNKFMEFLYTITEPILEPVRNLINKFSNGPMYVDFSPVVVFLLITLIQRLLF